MENMELPQGFEWCRKSEYSVMIELACFEYKPKMVLPEGFELKEFEANGEKKTYAVKSGFNVLEQNHWTTSPAKPYVITGTVGERWPVKPSNLSAYDVDPLNIGVEPQTVSTKKPDNQEFMVAVHIPEGITATVTPSWAFGDDGTVDKTQNMVANSESSMVKHDGGDYIVAKHIPGMPEYWQLPEEVRNTRETAKLYDPRIVNGSIMKTTYDHALTQEEIVAKYQTGLKV